jgi:hypothetical protein
MRERGEGSERERERERENIAWISEALRCLADGKAEFDFAIT